MLSFAAVEFVLIATVTELVNLDAAHTLNHNLNAAHGSRVNIVHLLAHSLLLVGELPADSPACGPGHSTGAVIIHVSPSSTDRDDDDYDYYYYDDYDYYYYDDDDHYYYDGGYCDGNDR